MGAALTGGGGSDNGAVEQQQPQQYPQQYQQQQQPIDSNNPCNLQLKQFLDCAQNQQDVSLCQMFNQALKDCKINYGPIFIQEFAIF